MSVISRLAQGATETRNARQARHERAGERTCVERVGCQGRADLLEAGAQVVGDREARASCEWSS